MKYKYVVLKILQLRKLHLILWIKYSPLGSYLFFRFITPFERLFAVYIVVLRWLIAFLVSFYTYRL